MIKNPSNHGRRSVALESYPEIPGVLNVYWYVAPSFYYRAHIVWDLSIKACREDRNLESASAKFCDRFRNQVGTDT